MVTILLTERESGYVLYSITVVNVTRNFGGFRQKKTEVGWLAVQFVNVKSTFAFGPR